MSSIEYFERRNNERLKKELEDLENQRLSLKMGNKRRSINLEPLHQFVQKEHNKPNVLPCTSTHLNQNMKLRNGLISFKIKSQFEI